MSTLTRIAVLSATLSFSSLSALAADQSTVARDAERLGQCMVALDADCLVPVLYVEGYEALSPPGFKLWAQQKRFFDAIRSGGGRYTEFRVLRPFRTLSSGDQEFVLVHYRSASRLTKEQPEKKVSGYLIGVPEEGGRSWRFLDTLGLTRDQVHKALPALDAAMLPSEIGAAPTG